MGDPRQDLVFAAQGLVFTPIAIAVAALVIWFSFGDGPAPSAVPAPAVQTTPLAPGGPWADVG